MCSQKIVNENRYHNQKLKHSRYVPCKTGTHYKTKTQNFYGRHSRIEIWNVLGSKNLPSNHVRRVMGRVPHFHHGLHSPSNLL